MADARSEWAGRRCAAARLYGGILTAAVLMAVPASAQGRLVGRDARVYGGLGVGKGIGAVVEGSSPVLDLFTREAALGLTLRFSDDDDTARLVASGSVGVGIRLLRVASAARSRGIPTGDLDVGVRVGPSFSAALGRPSASQRGRAFAVFADPFARATRRVRGREAFLEIGGQAPLIRAGLTTRIGR